MPNRRIMFSSASSDHAIRPKLFGIGSAGCNIIEGATLPTIALTTSSADLARSHAERKFLLGADRLVGLSDPSADVLKLMPSIVGHELLDLFNNTDIAFMMCGLGALTGSLGTKMLCSVAKAKGALGVVLAATPFTAESIRRRELASRVMSDVSSTATLTIEFDNDKLSSLAPNIPLSRAFGLLNGIMIRPVADLCAAMSRDDLPLFREGLGVANYGRFGLGLGRGDERVGRVVGEALSSPWFDFDLSLVTSAIAIYSASDPWDKEGARILQLLEERLPSASIQWGSYADPKLTDRIRLSLLLCRQMKK